jgi:hypothetical protein
MKFFRSRRKPATIEAEVSELHKRRDALTEQLAQAQAELTSAITGRREHLIAGDAQDETVGKAVWSCRREQFGLPPTALLGQGVVLCHCFFSPQFAEALADQALFGKQAHQGIVKAASLL